MTLQQLDLFLAAAEHGSFSAAADDRHMAQPSLSEQIRRLEAELGVALFHRVGRGIVVTEAGRALHPHAQRVLAEAEAARASVSEVRELRGGTASFGIFGTSGSYLGPELVAGFRRRYPDVRVRLVGQNSSEVAEAVRSGELEAGLVALPVDDRGLEVHPAMSDEVVFASADPAHLRRPMTMERLAKVPLVLSDATFGSDDPTRRHLNELAQRAGVTIEPQIEVEEVQSAVLLAAQGLGDTVVALGMLADLGRRIPDALGWVPFAEPLMETFAFVWRRGAHLSPATRALVALAQERLEDLSVALEHEPPRRRPAGDGAP